MTQAKQILQMIETVDPGDLWALNEIDIAVYSYINELAENGYINTPQYTKSRDALKKIRPKGFNADIPTKPYKEIYEVEQNLGSEEEGRWHYNLVSRARTEELAELHAIIQAIEWERNRE